MEKFEAKTLEAAYALATRRFDCSLTELDCEIIQHPSSGLLGLFAKQAIIVVAPKHAGATAEPEQRPVKKAASPSSKPRELKSEAHRSVVSGQAKADKSKADKPKADKPKSDKPQADKHTVAQETVLESFFDEERDATPQALSDEQPALSTAPLQEEIEKELGTLISCSCFDIDVVEVDVIDNTAYIFIDGEDAALLIGKEGYRYNALSYLISNWLKNKYSLYIKLEIAQFLASQQEMIRSYMVPVIEHVEQEGWGRTRALDGILVQIALEQLREEFPNKYVAIKRARNGERYVLINEFNKR